MLYPCPIVKHTKVSISWRTHLTKSISTLSLHACGVTGATVAAQIAGTVGLEPTSPESESGMLAATLNPKIVLKLYL